MGLMCEAVQDLKENSGCSRKMEMASSAVSQCSQHLAHVYRRQEVTLCP